MNQRHHPRKSTILGLPIGDRDNDPQRKPPHAGDTDDSRWASFSISPPFEGSKSMRQISPRWGFRGPLGWLIAKLLFAEGLKGGEGPV